MDFIRSEKLYAEESLFSQAVFAGEIFFTAQDARLASHSGLNLGDVETQARSSFENLKTILEISDIGIENVMSLMIYLTNYKDLPAILRIIDAYFPDPEKLYPATSFIGAMSLDGGCSLRLEVVATSSSHREQIRVENVGLAQGSKCHGVGVGDLIFLSGVDASNPDGTMFGPDDEKAQTAKVYEKIQAIAQRTGLSLGNLTKTFTFLPDAEYRPGYMETRKVSYKGHFEEDSFPANTGIIVKDLGDDVLFKVVPIMSRHRDRAYITSEKAWHARGLFSQAVRVGNWLFLAGQDSMGPDGKCHFPHDLKAQTQEALSHIKYVLEAAGGSLANIVRTTCYLVEGQDRSQFAAEYKNFFTLHNRGNHTPPGLTLGVKSLYLNCVVEIDATAYMQK